MSGILDKQPSEPPLRQLHLNSTSLATGQLSFRQTMKAAWDLTLPFFTSPEHKKRAQLLLAGIGALALSQVGVALLYNMWWGQFWDHLANHNKEAILTDLLLYAAIAIPGIATTAALPYVNGLLHLQWRQWMTDRLQNSWFSHHAYSRLPHNNGPTDNADQRVTNDPDDFIWRSLTMSTALLNAVTTMTIFSGVLWKLSGSPLLIGLAFGYAAGGTYLVQKLGKKLPFLHNNHRQFEADYRYALVRAREYGESISFYGGEKAELKTLSARFNRLVTNTKDLLRTNLHVMTFASAYGTIASPLPIFALLPRFFAKQISIGGMHQASQAFGHVQGALSWFVHTYNDFAQYKTVTKRLTEFNKAVNEWNIAMTARQPGLKRVENSSGLLEIQSLLLTKPDTGEVLVKPFSLVLNPGDRLVLTGVTGSGKSSLLRVLTGLWDHEEGEITVQKSARILCIPQKPYLPLLSLRGIVCYPGDPSEFTDQQIESALSEVGLSQLMPSLDDESKDGLYWSRTLSGGMQQRLAFARIFLHRPDVLMLDEVSASLDPNAESYLHERLNTLLPDTTIISVAHRPKVLEFHTLHGHIEDRTLNVRSLGLS